MLWRISHVFAGLLRAVVSKLPSDPAAQLAILRIGIEWAYSDESSLRQLGSCVLLSLVDLHPGTHEDEMALHAHAGLQAVATGAAG